MKNVTIDRETKRYTIKVGNSYSCYGFDVVKRRAVGLSKELGIPLQAKYKGTMKMYREYVKLVNEARKRHESTGFRSQIELFKPFIGHEGRRVEVEWTWDEKERFYIGRSTGCIPCHLIIKTRRSPGGSPVLNNCIKNWRFV